VLGRLRALDAELAEPLGRHELVVGDDLHLEGLCPLRDELPDPTESDHSQRLAVELVAGEPRTRPLAVDQRGVRARDVARQRQGERQSVLGRSNGVRFGSVDHHDPALGRGVDVDVVNAGPGAPDHLEAQAAFHQLRGDLGRRAHDDRVEVADPVAQLVVRHVEPHLDVEVLAQERDAGVGDLLLDQDLRLAVGAGHYATGSGASPASAKTRWAPAAPEPGSASWPRSRSAISSAVRATTMSNAP
jgi:hypothetical protein